MRFRHSQKAHKELKVTVALCAFMADEVMYFIQKVRQYLTNSLFDN